MKEKAKSDPQITGSILISSNKPTMSADGIVEIERFSRIDKLLRCILSVFRFISNCKSAIRKSELNLEQNRPRDDSTLKPDIKVNDICILRDSQAKRVFWKLCKVEQLVTGRDGSVRSARIAVLSNDIKKLF